MPAGPVTCLGILHCSLNGPHILSPTPSSLLSRYPAGPAACPTLSRSTRFAGLAAVSRPALHFPFYAGACVAHRSATLCRSPFLRLLRFAPPLPGPGTILAYSRASPGHHMPLGAFPWVERSSVCFSRGSSRSLLSLPPGRGCDPGATPAFALVLIYPSLYSLPLAPPPASGGSPHWLSRLPGYVARFLQLARTPLVAGLPLPSFSDGVAVFDSDPSPQSVDSIFQVAFVPLSLPLPTFSPSRSCVPSAPRLF